MTQPKDKAPSVPLDVATADDETVTMTIRAPKKLVDAYDKIAGDGQRAEGIRQSMVKQVEAAGKGEEIALNYDTLVDQAGKARRRMDNARTALKGKLVAVEHVALGAMPLTTENIPAIIKFISNYQITPEDGFDQYNVSDYIALLEDMLEHERLQALIKKELEKRYGKAEEAKTTKKKSQARWIPPESRCNCGLMETKAEHNQRCRRVRDEMLSGVNRFYKTGEAQFEMIKKCGAEWFTSSEDRALVQKFLEEKGTDKQKESYNQYLASHGYPAAFKLEPEAENVAVEDAAKSEET